MKTKILVFVFLLLSCGINSSSFAFECGFNFYFKNGNKATFKLDSDDPRTDTIWLTKKGQNLNSSIIIWQGPFISAIMGTDKISSSLRKCKEGNPIHLNVQSSSKASPFTWFITREESHLMMYLLNENGDIQSSIFSVLNDFKESYKKLDDYQYIENISFLELSSSKNHHPDQEKLIIQSYQMKGMSPTQGTYLFNPKALKMIKLDSIFRNTYPRETIKVENGMLHLQHLEKPFDLAKLNLDVQLLASNEILNGEGDAQNEALEWVSSHFVDLVKAAKDSTYSNEPIYDKSYEQVLNKMSKSIFSRRSPILLGESGIGKTAIIQQFAKAVALGKFPNLPSHTKIFEISPERLEVDTKYVGEFEKKQEMLLQAGKLKNIIYVFDPLHNIAGVGSHSYKPSDISQFLKKALSRKELLLIAADTHQEFQNTFSKDRGFMDQFDSISLQEPSDRELMDIASFYMRSKYKMEMNDEVIQEAIKISRNYDVNGLQPRSLIQLLDRTAEVMQDKKEDSVSVAVLKEAASSRYHCDAAHFDYGQACNKINQMKMGLSQLVGSELAKQAIVSTWRAKLTGFTDPQSVNTVLLVGPPGVGKTKIAEVSAELMGVPYTEIAMNRFQNGDIDGFLREVYAALEKSPFHVINLDELEKAPVRVQDAALQMLQSGKFTVVVDKSKENHVTRVANAKNALFILTSNVGGDFIRKELRMRKTISIEELRPLLESRISEPLLSRLQRIVPMGSPSMEDFELALKMYLERTLSRINQGKVGKFNITNPTDFIRSMVAQYYHEKTDYRDVGKIIQFNFIDFLTEIATQTEFVQGSHLTLTWRSDSQSFLIDTKEKQKVDDYEN